MSTLSARDALVAHVCRVSEEDRPLAMEPAATCLYAVFAADDRTRFLGLVSAGEVAENPGRLFADLLPRRLPCVVADTEPLEEILRCMDRSDHWCFPVVDGQGCFIGAVTRASVLEVLLRTHGRLLEDNRRLTRRLLVLQERERRRMARELHDELGQYLAALRTELEHLRLLSGDDDRFLRQIGAIEEVLAHVHHAVRHLMNRLRPELLDQLGLPDTLRELVAEFQNRFPNVAFFLVLSGELRDLPDEHAIVLYRVVQESLTNVVRHADAKEVWICLCRHRRCDTPVCGAYFSPSSCRANTVHLLIHDNGRGFVPDHGVGVGLFGMRERVESLNGSFRIDSRPGQGTWVVVELPLSEVADDDPTVAGG